MLTAAEIVKRAQAKGIDYKAILKKADCGSDAHAAAVGRQSEIPKIHSSTPLMPTEVKDDERNAQPDGNRPGQKATPGAGISAGEQAATPTEQKAETPAAQAPAAAKPQMPAVAPKAPATEAPQASAPSPEAGVPKPQEEEVDDPSQKPKPKETKEAFIANAKTLTAALFQLKQAGLMRPDLLKLAADALEVTPMYMDINSAEGVVAAGYEEDSPKVVEKIKQASEKLNEKILNQIVEKLGTYYYEG